jgi:hypothetical protein
MARIVLLGFAAGFLSVLIFHQGTVFLLHHLWGLFPTQGYSMNATQPLGVPQVISAAFFGGLWGIVIAFVVARGGQTDLLMGFLIGALGATLVGWTVVAALKGNALFGGFDVARWWRPVLLNGAFGWGTALLLRPLRLRH